MERFLQRTCLLVGESGIGRLQKASSAVNGRAYTAEGLASGGMTPVDGDRGKTRLMRYCLEKDLPIIGFIGAANRLNPLNIDADIQHAHICPMARKISKKPRQYGIRTGLPAPAGFEIHRILD